MDLEKVKKRIEKRYDERQVRLEGRRNELFNKIKSNVPNFLCELPSVTKIVIFGSLVRTGYFTELSDVDIAIKDLPNSEYWQALLWFERLLKFENIDLVRIEDANPRIKRYIDKGKIVYEQEV